MRVYKYYLKYLLMFDVIVLTQGKSRESIKGCKAY